ncbi:NF-kappa-B inhibitor epsilon [Bombina bombina]|uniref:NF-kappa-B inhibitor epsilon n=1 Tax=Bombina bombina TaxID=8345 RepID=UPI00235A5656|nr:NF-kappa-B inhibitor epsilon [Bombina bombina]
MMSKFDMKNQGSEEGQCDSGIAESVQSLTYDGLSQLSSLPKVYEPQPTGCSPQKPDFSEGKVSEAPELERIDSAYGSSSITEPLLDSCLPHRKPQEAERLSSQEAELLSSQEVEQVINSSESKQLEAGRLSTEEMEALAYLSEEGDT